MGYLSNVVIKCQNKAFDMLTRAFSMGMEPDYIGRDKHMDEYVITWDDVKWYDTYEEVRAIEAVLSELDMHDDPHRNGYGYSFIRVGDDYSDVEERTNDYEIGLYVERTIAGYDDCHELDAFEYGSVLHAGQKTIDNLEINNIGEYFL